MKNTQKIAAAAVASALAIPVGAAVAMNADVSGIAAQAVQSTAVTTLRAALNGARARGADAAEVAAIVRAAVQASPAEAASFVQLAVQTFPEFAVNIVSEAAAAAPANAGAIAAAAVTALPANVQAGTAPALVAAAAASASAAGTTISTAEVSSAVSSANPGLSEGSLTTAANDVNLSSLLGGDADTGPTGATTPADTFTGLAPSTDTVADAGTGAPNNEAPIATAYQNSGTTPTGGTPPASAT